MRGYVASGRNSHQQEIAQLLRKLKHEELLACLEVIRDRLDDLPIPYFLTELADQKGGLE